MGKDGIELRQWGERRHSVASVYDDREMKGVGSDGGTRPDEVCGQDWRGGDGFSHLPCHGIGIRVGIR